MFSRRRFIQGAGTVAFSGLALSMTNISNAKGLKKNKVAGYGVLKADPNKLIDLPDGFQYQVISKFGDVMDDGLQVPDRADGMGCIVHSKGKVVLVRNHELSVKHLSSQPISIQQFQSDLAYDKTTTGIALPGGTSSILYNLESKRVEKQYLSLIGTIRNCSGGTTPWGSWLSCEETVLTAGKKVSKDHGFIFEVTTDKEGLVSPVPLKAMGRFNHEAACVDPNTGIVYLTEDRADSLFYRFIPNVYGNLHRGGRLQALAIKGMPKFDSRNWQTAQMKKGKWLEATWVDLDNPESPADDLRLRGYNLGATLFARGEGIHWGDNELYFTCTNGGQQQLGQIMRYQPSYKKNGLDNNLGKIQLFVESNNAKEFNFGDNLTVTPQGHLLVCEDQYTEVVDNYLRGVTPSGDIYDFARLNLQTELAGACFSPDGKVLFVNIYSPAMTLAIEGPWGEI